MLIPLWAEYDARRRPVVTETLILLNVLVYLIGIAGAYFGLFEIRAFVDAGAYQGFDPQLSWRLISYQFLHDPISIWHILFNMLFLWVFGGPVEDRLGRAGFVGFYLIGGAVAGLGHAMFSNAPVIGASGSVAAVTGAFLALFPRSTIKVLLFFIIIGLFSIPSLWFIGLYFAIDLLRMAAGLFGGEAGNVAYMAHLAGNLYGFLLAFTLLAMRIIRRSDTDVFFLLTQRRRRTQFRAAQRMAKGAMWDTPRAPSAREHEQAANEKNDPERLTDEQREDAGRRSRINALIAEHDLAGAAALYREMLEENPRTVFPEPRQLDLANQLSSEGHHDSAARAYELFLESYPGSPSAFDVRLMLGVLYARRLNRPEKARTLLSQARPRLSGREAELADTILTELPPA